MYPHTLSFFMDYKCNYYCDHCSAGSHPSRSSPLPLEVIKKLLDEGKPLGFKLAVFTGGEPTLDMKKLLSALEYAKSLGYKTRVVTNGWWAKTPESALQILSEMKDAGLDELNTDFDDYHLDLRKKRWDTSAQNFVNIAKATVDLDIPLGIGIIKGPNTIIDREFVAKFLAVHLKMSMEEVNKKFKFVEDVVARIGRAAKEIPREEVPERELPVSGCNDIGMVYGVHPDGRITVCCGHAIFVSDAYDIGNWKEEDEPLKTARKRASQNLIYWWIWAVGPKKILKKLGIEKKTTHICDACKILLVDHRKEFIEYFTKHKEEILINEILLNNRARETLNLVKKVGEYDIYIP